MGCKVFTTVSNKEKRDFLKNMYPQLEDANIGKLEMIYIYPVATFLRQYFTGNSRNSSFRKVIMENTDGKGVDVILNSLAGDLFQQSLKCIATRGRFLEIGKVEFFNRTSIDSNIFFNNCSFHGITLDEFFHNEVEVKQTIKDLLSEGILFSQFQTFGFLYLFNSRNKEWSCKTTAQKDFQRKRS